MSTFQTYSDNDLLFRIAEGDNSAMKALFDEYFSRLYYFAFKLIEDDSEAEDIAQEAILQFWKKKDEFKHQAIKDVESFLFTVARNRCYNYTRDKNTHAQKLEMLGASQDVTEHTLELNLIREDIFNRIYEEIRQLSPAQVQLLKMIFIENLETSEIAERLQITPNNVRNQKARALEKLKTALLRKRLMILILIFFY